MVLHGLEMVFEKLIFNLPRKSEVGSIPICGYQNRDTFFFKSINLKSGDKMHYILINWLLGYYTVIFICTYIFIFTYTLVLNIGNHVYMCVDIPMYGYI